MFNKTLLAVPVLIVASLVGTRPAHAQFAVIDVAAIAQFIEQIATLKEQLDTMGEQLQTARDDLDQARQAYRSMTGARGMEQLLRDTHRNYLPNDWAGLEALGAGAQALIDANAGLTPAEVDSLWADARNELTAKRQSAALFETVAREALSTTSARFALLDQLIAAIGGAADVKAILDLQARIAAEVAMLQNEATKLNLINQNIQAEQAAQRLRREEKAIADIGSLRDLPPMGL